MASKTPKNGPNFMNLDNLPPGGAYCYLMPDGKTFVLTKDFETRTTLGNITIPAGFISDGPSIPERLRSVISVLGKHIFPAFLHDYWYRVPKARVISRGPRKKYVSRELADNIFLQEMKDLKVPWWRRRLMWRMVGAFGASSWREK